MGRKAIELGLGDFNPREVSISEVKDGQYEEENASYRQKGSDRMTRTWEGISGGFMKIVKRGRSAVEAVGSTAKAGAEIALSAPEMVGDAIRAAHEKGGEIRASVIDRIDAGVGKVGETVEAGAEAVINKAGEIKTSIDAGREAVVNRAKDTYKSLETRSINAANRFMVRSREIQQNARNKWDAMVNLKRRKEHEKSLKDLAKVVDRVVATAKAAGIDFPYSKTDLLLPGMEDQEEQQAA